jgi:hypothetical protein
MQRQWTTLAKRGRGPVLALKKQLGTIGTLLPNSAITSIDHFRRAHQVLNTHWHQSQNGRKQKQAQ